MQVLNRGLAEMKIYTCLGIRNSMRKFSNTLNFLLLYETNMYIYNMESGRKNEYYMPKKKKGKGKTE